MSFPLLQERDGTQAEPRPAAAIMSPINNSKVFEPPGFQMTDLATGDQSGSLTSLHTSSAADSFLCAVLWVHQMLIHFDESCQNSPNKLVCPLCVCLSQEEEEDFLPGSAGGV